MRSLFDAEPAVERNAPPFTLYSPPVIAIGTGAFTPKIVIGLDVATLPGGTGPSGRKANGSGCVDPAGLYRSIGTVELMRSSPKPVGPPSQDCSKSTARRCTTPEATSSSSTTNRPESVLHPRPLPLK